MKSLDSYDFTALPGLDQLRSATRQGPPQSLARIIPLAFLAPDITQAILGGTQPPELTLAKLRRPLPLSWPEQRRVLGFPNLVPSPAGVPAP